METLTLDSDELNEALAKMDYKPVDLDPTVADTNKDGIIDALEDFDKDGITNEMEQRNRSLPFPEKELD